MVRLNAKYYPCKLKVIFLLFLKKSANDVVFLPYFRYERNILLTIFPLLI